MSEILEMLRTAPGLTWNGIETSSEEIETLIKEGIKYREFKRQLKEGGVSNE